jgi:hypothetical protein
LLLLGRAAFVRNLLQFLAVGFLFFLLSDTFIGYRAFVDSEKQPFDAVVVMGTYYLAQLLIASGHPLAPRTIAAKAQ